MKKASKRSEPRKVELVRGSYQPSRAELREGPRVDATFEEVVEACLGPGKIRCVMPPNKRGR